MNVISLYDWLQIVPQRVPHIPAEELGAVPVKDIWDALEEDDPWHWSGPLRAMMAAAKAAIEPGYMFRWDCCSSSRLKCAMSKPNSALSDALGDQGWRFDRSLDDGRFIDILVEFPGDTMRLWKRPWRMAKMVDGYPVEFRAFVQDGKVLGVSSYYPQRPLPDSYRGSACIIRDLTELLLVEPGMSFTADWLLGANGDDLWWLEGGPPHVSGPGSLLMPSAHPCAFAPGQIDGIALAPRPGALEE
jgi:hypothetical protein